MPIIDICDWYDYIFFSIYQFLQFLTHEKISIHLLRVTFSAHQTRTSGTTGIQTWKQSTAAVVYFIFFFSVSFMTWKRLLSSGIGIVRVTASDGAFLNVIWPTLFKTQLYARTKLMQQRGKKIIINEQNNLCSGTADSVDPLHARKGRIKKERER